MNLLQLVLVMLALPTIVGLMLGAITTLMDHQLGQPQPLNHGIKVFGITFGSILALELVILLFGVLIQASV